VVYWGEDWNRADQMHYDLTRPEGDADTEKLARDLLAGYLGIYVPGQTVPPPALSRAEGYAVRIINEGRRRGVTPKGIQIALATGIVESNITVYANQKLPKSLALPHGAVGNDGYSVGIFQQQVRNSGNGWWWGDEQTCMGVESSAGLFYDRLVRLPYNGDSKSPGAFAQQIQGSAFPDRYDQHWGEAVALYNKLAGITPTQGDDMAAVPQNEWNAVRDIVLAQVESWSPFRRPGETRKVPWQQMLQAMDANTHGPRTIILAAHGHPGSIQDLRLVADLDPNRFPDRADDKNLATAILADLATEDGRQKRLDAAVAQLTGGLVTSVQSIPPTVYSAPVGDSNGAKVGQFVDAADNLPPVSQKTIDALHTALEVRPA
jgi:hypothetical protein